METVDTIVVGGGVIGLSCAYALACEGREVMVLEKHDAVGQEISSRNSGVIHAGLYYPAHSLKARACVEGKALLYEFCCEYGVPHKRIGKLVVATSTEQEPQLQALYEQARINHVDDVRMLSAQDVRALEPALSCHAAMLSPSTGIVDTHALLLALQGALEARGGQVVLGETVSALEKTGEAYQLTMVGGYSLRAEHVIVAAGLGGNQLLSTLKKESPSLEVPPLYYAKGNYFSLTGSAPFSHLIYPLPENGGLGVHLTLDMGGQARFGPDVEWVDHVDYTVDPARKNIFYEKIRHYWPELPDNSLHEGFAGIRPKIAPQGARAADFQILGGGHGDHSRLLAFCGVESPGLTASLCLGRMASRLLSVQSAF
ncbi:NAD(P)/FAD-dependent oxidoreductase [Flexibacterium corallicola]|uniref:NAD(P)/FAD-dependent oxidoreductase n=1 Tax=Flexibacterium corallicola TaxID=3037259 RepID=UPI00286FA510|nr:NAD(P)/FAD-dependent oxidoreductase [Pseudovibrio sp. M1P-2-3]